MDTPTATFTVYAGDRLGDDNFGTDHPFRPLRYTSFPQRIHQLGLERHYRIVQPVMAKRTDIERF
jgi:acetoin utilization deacetylase AcuC-like enzyme